MFLLRRESLHSHHSKNQPKIWKSFCRGGNLCTDTSHKISQKTGKRLVPPSRKSGRKLGKAPIVVGIFAQPPVTKSAKNWEKLLLRWESLHCYHSQKLNLHESKFISKSHQSPKHWEEIGVPFSQKLPKTGKTSH